VLSKELKDSDCLEKAVVVKCLTQSLAEAVITQKAMLIKNVSVKLKRSRLNLITNTNRIRIVLCKGVKKDGCLKTQQRDQEEKGVFMVQRLSSDVLVKRVK
jgi:hypothetical protein